MGNVYKALEKKVYIRWESSLLGRNSKPFCVIFFILVFFFYNFFNIKVDFWNFGERHRSRIWELRQREALIKKRFGGLLVFVFL